MSKTGDFLIACARQYETVDFLRGDPSWFMHQVQGWQNQETMAFLAAALSYGSRRQFMSKIQFLADCTSGNPYRWVAEGLFERDISDTSVAFYRFYTNARILLFLRAYKDLLVEYQSIKGYLQAMHATTAMAAIEAITAWFSNRPSGGVVPQNASSSCKRLCMFLRWMVRKGSPVDLGLWNDLIDKRTLIIPLDTHVLSEARRLRLTHAKAPSMHVAREVTEKLKRYFPNDPLQGDFAMFGYGVTHAKNLKF